MELATGKVRVEFSGPGALHWYASFAPDASFFLSTPLFSNSVSLWPIASQAEADRRKGRAAPKPLHTFDGERGLIPQAAAVARGGQWIALGLNNGELLLKSRIGDAPSLLAVPGKKPATPIFTRSGRHLVCVKGGAVHAWPLRASKPK